MIDGYVVVFSPDVESVNEELLNLDLSDFADGSKFQFDLVTFVGNRQERYLEFQIQNGKIDMTTIKKG